MSIKFISIRSINKRVNTYIGSTWCTWELPLQSYRDITSVLFCRLINVDILFLFLTKCICYKTEMPDNRHIVDVICMHLHVAVLPWYNFCIVLQIDQCSYFIIVIRYKIEMYVNIHSIDAIYMHLFQFIFLSSRYTFHGHFIPSFISNELCPSGYDGGGSAVLGVGILPWTRFLVIFTFPCSPLLDLQRSNETKHDIHPRY